MQPVKKKTKVDGDQMPEVDHNKKTAARTKKETKDTHEDVYKQMAARRKKFKEPTRELIPELVFEELGDIDDPDWALPADILQNADNDPAVQAAAAFLEQNRDAYKDEITITDVWNRLDIACQNPHHYSMTSLDDLSVISKTPMTSIEACLLSSSPFPGVGMFSAALQEAVQAKHERKAPTFIQCLTWLAFAVQSPVNQILPAGEYFHEADKYIEEYLLHPGLPKVEEDLRSDMVATNATRVFEYLTVCDLSSFSNEEKAMLLYAIGRILLDKRLTGLHFIHDRAVALFSQVLSCSKTPRSVIWELGQLLPRICDDLRGHRMFLDIVKKSEAPFPSCICLLAFIFLSVSERGECALDIMEEASDEDFAKECVDSIADMIDNVMEVYSEKNRHQQEAVLSMLASSLHPTIVRIMPEETHEALYSKLKRIEYDWGRDNHTDDQILQRVLVSSLNILNEEKDRKCRGLRSYY